MNNAQMTAEVRRQFIVANEPGTPVPPIRRSTNTRINLRKDARGNYQGDVRLEDCAISGEFGLPGIEWANRAEVIIWDYITPERV